MSSIPTQSKFSGLRPPSKISRPPTGAGGALAGGAHLSVSRESISSTSGAATMASTRAIPATSTPARQLTASPAPSAPSPSPDSLIIGDKVVVGNRPGKVAFIGEVKFAKGDWVGVVLDEAAGKNDGSVAGVRYFQCEANHGLFVMLHKVQKVAPASPLPPPSKSSSTLQQSSTASRQPQAEVPPTPVATDQSGMAIGDRVMVGGRVGSIRYLGATSFAPGEWVGVELDGPLGKNDGSVQGKRYFECRPLFGLFAPMQKVQKVDATHPVPCPTPGSVIPPVPATALAKGGSSRNMLGSTIRRVDSAESVNSVASSVMSSASRSGARPVRNAISNSSAALSQKQPAERRMSGQIETLHKALREKEEHVDQLLKEIDLSRNEIARESSRADSLEATLVRTNTDHEQYVFDTNERIVQLNAYVAKMETEKQMATTGYDDERRKVEDLLFQLEEQSLTTDEMMKAPKSSRSEAEFEAQSRTIESLQREIVSSVEKACSLEGQVETLQSELVAWASKFKSSEEKIISLQSSLDNEVIRCTSLQKEVDSLKTEVEEKKAGQAKESELHSQIASLQKSLAELEVSHMKKVSDADTAKTRVSELEACLGKLNSENDDLKSKMSDLDDKLRRSTQSESVALRDMQDALNKQSEELRSVKAKASESEQSARQRESRLQTENEGFAQQTAELEGKLVDCKKLQEESTLKLRETQSALEKSEGKSESLQRRESELVQKLANLEALIQQSSASESAALKGMETSLASKTAEFQEAMAKLEESRKAKEAEVESLTAEMANKTNTHEAEMRAKTTLLAELAKKLSEVEAELAHKSQVEVQLADLKDQLAPLRTCYDDLLTKSEANIKRENELLATNAEMSQKISVLEADISRLQSGAREAGDRDRELAEVKQANQILVERRDELEKTLDQKSSESETLRRTVEELQTTIESGAKLSSEKMKFEEEIADLKKTNTALQSQIITLENQLTELKSNLCQVIFDLSFEPAFNRKLAVAAASFMMPRGNTTATKEGDDKAPDSPEKRPAPPSAEKKDAKVDSNKTLDKDRPPVPPRPPKSHSIMAMLRQQLPIRKNSPRHAKPDDGSKMADGADDELNKVQGQLESANKMIDFLHSVIADQQKRLEMVNEVSPLNESSPTDVKLPTRPPRLYCDICECFDLHSTEDCPQQGENEGDPVANHRASPRSSESMMSNTSSGIGLQNNKRKAPPPPRPYCTTCEVFGHTAESCVSDLTF